MRWPNRHPHTLTHGMRRAQKAMANFVGTMDWTRFARRNLPLGVTGPFHAFACGDEHQALVWLLRHDSIGKDGLLRRDVEPVRATFTVSGLADGTYRISSWDTEAGTPAEAFTVEAQGGQLDLTTAPILTDRAFAITRY
jgi:mannan endo-1,4-beta-mannosidase